MSEIQKQENRIMGEYSIAKSFKGILRIAHILELVKNEKDIYKNPTYYGRPGKLMNISGGTYKSDETGYSNPSKGLDGTITRYSDANSEITGDDLRVQRVPMTDSMGNYMNWNIGFDGVTIGSNEDINSTSIEIEKFKQNDFLIKQSTDDFIWQEKYFPVLESGNIIIGLDNKEYPSDKYKVNKDSGLVIENKKNLGKLVIENRYDKTKSQTKLKSKHTFINYEVDANKKFRTIYHDNKSVVEDYDVFMYKQDDFDYDNYYFKTKVEETPTDNDLKVRGNSAVLNNYKKSTESQNVTWTSKNEIIDCNVGVINLKGYVQELIEKYLGSSLVEVPSGTVINQFCTLEKWYAYPDDGTKDEMLDSKSELLGSSFPGHRPAMMSKRDVGMMAQNDPNYSKFDVKNAFVQSTILGACKDINKLLNTSYDYNNHETNVNQAGQDNLKINQQDLTYSKEGYYKEIIPLYKRDYVLCDGSIYAIWVFPKNFTTSSYPNRREAMDRFINLFFAIGYEYTQKKEYINRRFKFEWFENGTIPAYKIIRENSKQSDDKTKGEHLVTVDNCNFFKNANGEPDKGYPAIDTSYPSYLFEDKNALFVEDFLTILAFEKLYELYSKAGGAGIEWTNKNINKWLSQTEVPEKYKLTSFIGDSNSTIKSNLSNGKWINKVSKITNPNNPNATTTVTALTSNGKFVMELPYYNFINEGTEIATDDKLEKLPIVNLGREVKTFGDPIKFWDSSVNKWAIVEAYKIPQIQYMIDLFTNYPTPDTLADTLNTFYQYNFQVPNLCGNLPTFIGSSGISWADSQYRKIRQIESWSSNYAQYNYMHRHFVFVEPSELDPSRNQENYNYPLYTGQKGSHSHGWTASGPDKYKSRTMIDGNSYVASANLWGGYIIAECGGCHGYTSPTGEDAHPNYIWNELGAGETKVSNITLSNYPTVTNGMRYPILQVTSGGLAWTTGDARFSRDSHANDLKMTQSEDDYRNYGKSCWDQTDYVELPQSYRDGKLAYEKETGWYGWEHPEDPRFESAEPNRGRSSTPIQQTIFKDCISYIRYEKNKESFNITLDPTIKEAEWFSPENIKMLPLIKL